MVGEAIGDGGAFVVVVDRDRIREAVLLTAAHDVGGQRIQLVELAVRARAASVLEVPLALHPAVVLAVADDVDLFDVAHADIRREHRPVVEVP